LESRLLDGQISSAIGRAKSRRRGPSFGPRARPAIDWFCVDAALAFATAATGWNLVDRTAAHLLLATATVGGLLVGAALGRFKVLIMAYAAFIILLVGMTAGYAGDYRGRGDPDRLPGVHADGRAEADHLDLILDTQRGGAPVRDGRGFFHAHSVRHGANPSTPIWKKTRIPELLRQASASGSCGLSNSRNKPWVTKSLFFQ
jgi:hypothetical protein